MNIINATPHPINIVTSEGDNVKTFDASGVLPRLSMNTVSCDDLGGIPTSKTVFGDVKGLPDYQDGTYYIVSQMVKTALPNRSDLLVPAQVQRNDKGHIIGCLSLGR